MSQSCIKFSTRHIQQRSLAKLVFMDRNAVRALHDLLALLNQPNVNREVDRLFRSSSASSTNVTSTATATSTSTSTAATSTPSTPLSALNVSTTTSPSLLNVGPIFNANAVPSRGRRRGRGRVHPYQNNGYQFSRLVILLAGPTEDNLPRGRLRQVVRDEMREVRVCFRTGMTSQEIRTCILHTFQGQGHLRTMT